MTIEELKFAGYKPLSRAYPDRLYKEVKTETGAVKYDIMVSTIDTDTVAVFTPRAQMYLKDGRAVNVECVQWFNTFHSGYHSGRCIKEAEDFFESIYNAGGFVPAEMW